VGADKEGWTEIEKLYGMLSRYMSIPFPEKLDDETLMRKLRQLEWLMGAGHLPVKLKDGSLLPAEEINTDGEETDN
jgi:hypothetical protein